MGDRATTFTATEARDKFSEVFNLALYKGPVVIRRHNQAVAVIPIELLSVLTELEAEADTKKAQEAFNEYKSKGGPTLKQIKEELGLD